MKQNFCCPLCQMVNRRVKWASWECYHAACSFEVAGFPPEGPVKQIVTLGSKRADDRCHPLISRIIRHIRVQSWFQILQFTTTNLQRLAEFRGTGRMKREEVLILAAWRYYDSRIVARSHSKGCPPNPKVGSPHPMYVFPLTRDSHVCFDRTFCRKLCWVPLCPLWFRHPH